MDDEYLDDEYFFSFKHFLKEMYTIVPNTGGVITVASLIDKLEQTDRYRRNFALWKRKTKEEFVRRMLELTMGYLRRRPMPVAVGVSKSGTIIGRRPRGIPVVSDKVVFFPLELLQ